MKPEDIKLAALKLADLERIPQIIADLEAGHPFQVVVGDKNVNVPAHGGGDIRAATVTYLKDVAGNIEAELSGLDVELPEADDIDNTLAQLEADAQPNNGAPN